MSDGEAWKPRGMQKGDRLLDALKKAHRPQGAEVEPAPALPKKSPKTEKVSEPPKAQDCSNLISGEEILRAVLSDERVAGSNIPLSGPSSPTTRQKPWRNRGFLRSRQNKITASISGEQALSLGEEINARISTETFAAVARSLRTRNTLARQMARLRNLSDEVREMVRSDTLRFRPASFIATYPLGVQAVLAKGLLNGFVTGEDIAYGDIAQGGGTLRQRFEHAGLEWPEGLDDEGLAIPKEDFDKS